MGATESFIYSNLIVVIMDINREELTSLVDALELKDMDIVEYRGRNFWLQISKGLNPPAAWYSESTYVDGADVYIDKDLIPDRFKKPVIFHEILEADLRIHQNMPQDEAHRLARDEDRKYANKLLTESEKSDYEGLRKELGDFFGDS